MRFDIYRRSTTWNKDAIEHVHTPFHDIVSLPDQSICLSVRFPSAEMPSVRRCWHRPSCQIRCKMCVVHGESQSAVVACSHGNQRERVMRKAYKREDPWHVLSRTRPSNCCTSLGRKLYNSSQKQLTGSIHYSAHSQAQASWLAWTRRQTHAHARAQAHVPVEVPSCGPLECRCRQNDRPVRSVNVSINVLSCCSQPQPATRAAAQ